MQIQPPRFGFQPERPETFEERKARLHAPLDEPSDAWDVLGSLPPNALWETDEEFEQFLEFVRKSRSIGRDIP